MKPHSALGDPDAGFGVAERREPPGGLQVSVRLTGRLAPFRYFFNGRLEAATQLNRHSREGGNPVPARPRNAGFPPSRE